MALNNRDQNKWDQLQDKGSGAIDHILAGRGNESDFKQLSTLLSAQHDLAGQIFDQGLEDAKATADSIVDKLNQDRIDQGKKALTQAAQKRIFESTLSKVMADAIEDILGMVHDEFEKQTEEVKTGVMDALEKIRGLHVPKPGNREPQSPLDRLLNNEPSRAESPDAAEDTSGRLLMDRVLERHGRNTEQEQQRTEVFTAIKEAASAVKEKVTDLYNKFTGKDSEDEEEKKANLWIRALNRVLQPFKWAKNKATSAKTTLGKWMDLIGKPLLLAVMNPQLIKNITDAVSEYLSFDKIEDYLSRSWESVKEIGGDAMGMAWDFVTDKLYQYTGLDLRKKKAKPQSKTVAKPDMVKQAANNTAQVLPKEITADIAQRELPRWQNGLTQAQQTYAAAKAAYAASPTAANKKALDSAQQTLNLFQTRVTQYQQRAGMSTGINGTFFDRGSQVTMPQSSVSAVDTSFGGTTAIQPSTAVIGDMPTLTPGRAYEPPKPVEDTAPDTGQDKTAAVPRIGLGSYSFDSGDSALNIMNLGMIS